MTGLTNEELGKAIEYEALRRYGKQAGTVPSLPTIVIELVRTNWTPPKPVPPRLKMARKHLATEYKDELGKARVLRGEKDNLAAITLWLKGFDAAVKLAEPLIRYIESCGGTLSQDRDLIKTYREATRGE